MNVLWTDMSGGCVYSWGGSEPARAWRGRSPGGGPASQVEGVRPGVTRLAASRNSLAIGADGQVLTWGLNDSRGGGDAWFVKGGHGGAIPDSGQLGRRTPSGYGSTSDGGGGGRRHRRTAMAPAPIVDGELAAEGALDVASGRYHAIAVGLRTRAVYTWGLNDHGQLGRRAWAGRAADRPCVSGSRCRDGVPRTGPALSAPRLPAPVAVAAGRYFSAAVSVDGRVFAWGRCRCGRATADGGGPGGGGGDDGMADGVAAAVPYALSGGGLEAEHVVQLAAGYAHLLLLTRSGALYSCETGDDGYGGRLTKAEPLNAYGQLGHEGPPLVPQRVPPTALGVTPPRAIAAGRCASFALDASGQVREPHSNAHRPPTHPSPAHDARVAAAALWPLHA